ncbi:MAG: hypothetical protein JW870_11015 [Candidatus Delongbacteria bacterium]|nr:hypothetical protein [Candidatus Delongbacteria bacterium]
MSRIEDHSIFGNYNQTENRVTAALLQIMKIGGTGFIENLMNQIDDNLDFPKSEIKIVTQEKEKSNVYDGLLDCNFVFRVIIESKIESGKINKKQLEGILENAVNSTDYVLFITPENSKPSILENRERPIYWTNWKMINDLLKENNTNQEPLNFLINEFEKYLEFLKLLNVVSPECRVQIAAGSYGEPIALKYGFYACQNYRTIKESKYLAFYNNRGIHTLFEILEEPINDCDLSKLEDSNVKQYLSDHEPNYSSRDKRQFYRLNLIDDKLKIEHSGMNNKGKKTAFTMGVFRYTTIDKLQKAKTTEEL